MSNLGMTYKRRGPLTPEQSELAATWYRYALRLGFQFRSNALNDDEVIDLATDALLVAVRTHDRRPGGRCLSSWVAYCVRVWIHRGPQARWRSRSGKNAAAVSARIPPGMDIIGDPEPVPLETREHVAWLRATPPPWKQKRCAACSTWAKRGPRLGRLWAVRVKT